MTSRGTMTEAVALARAEGQHARPLPGPLAVAVAAVLVGEYGGLPCSTIATRLRRRKADVLATLRAHDAFTSSGSTSGRRWYVNPETALADLGRRARGGSRERTGTNDAGDRGSKDAPVQNRPQGAAGEDAPEHWLADEEHWLAVSGGMHTSPVAWWLVVGDPVQVEPVAVTVEDAAA